MWLKKNLNLLAIIGACIVVLVFFQKKEDYVAEYNAKIEALEAKVDSLHSENTTLEKESKLLEDKIADYDQRIKNLNVQIKVIKNETKQKIDAVDFFGDDELEQFFANRYKHITSGQHKDSIN